MIIELLDLKDIYFKIYPTSYVASKKDDKYHLTFTCRLLSLDKEYNGISNTHCKLILKPYNFFSKFLRILKMDIFRNPPEGFLKIIKLNDPDAIFQMKIEGTLYLDEHSYNGIIGNLENLTRIELGLIRKTIDPIKKWKEYEPFAKESVYYDESENAEFFIVNRMKFEIFRKIYS